MSGVPDLPMRERIAEVLTKHDLSWQGGDHPADSLHLECACGIAWSVEAEWSEGLAHQADAVLAVLADLPDTAVEAGAEALCLPAPISPGAAPLECKRHHRVIFDNGCRRCRGEARLVLTAIIAAIKEGRA